MERKRRKEKSVDEKVEKFLEVHPQEIHFFTGLVSSAHPTVVPWLGQGPPSSLRQPVLLCCHITLGTTAKSWLKRAVPWPLAWRRQLPRDWVGGWGYPVHLCWRLCWHWLGRCCWRVAFWGRPEWPQESLGYGRGSHDSGRENLGQVPERLTGLVEDSGPRRWSTRRGLGRAVGCPGWQPIGDVRHAAE